MADIITRLLTLVNEHGPLEAERIVRSQDGGCRHYVAARMPANHAATLGQLLQQGVAPAEAFKRAGISKRTGWRVLSRPARSVPNRG
jgi:hypothetical protein